MKKSLISLIAALLVMVALPITSAFAASVTSQVQKLNCVERILPLQHGQLSSKVASTACFPTFSQAIAYATSGAILLPAAETPQNLTAAQMKSAKMRPFTTTIIAYMYSDTGYDGSTLTITTTSSHPTCNSGYDYGLASMPTGWDNVVSSLKVSTAQDGCVYTRLYSDTNYGGANQCYNGDTSDVGSVMDNQTSSARWSLTLPTGC